MPWRTVEKIAPLSGFSFGVRREAGFVPLSLSPSFSPSLSETAFASLFLLSRGGGVSHFLGGASFNAHRRAPKRQSRGLCTTYRTPTYLLR